MRINDEVVEQFRRRMKAELGAEFSAAEAKGRYLGLLNLYWILAHEPPEQGELPEDPPSPPWL